MNPLRRWLVPVLSIAAPLPAQSDAITHADIEALAERGVALARTAAAPQAGFVIGVSGGTAKLLLREIRVCIDDGACTRYEYNVDEAKTLAGGALHLLPVEDIAPGSHRLQADAVALDPLAPPYAPRTRTELDLRIDRSADAATAVELRFDAGGFFRGAELRARETHDVRSLLPRAAQYLRADGRAIEAAAIWPQAADDAFSDRVPTDAFVRRYNDAVAMIAGSAPAQGFEQLRGLAADDHADPWLRDRANMTLGEQLLVAHRNAEAAQAFRNVRSPGPFANRALLELGWTYLLPTADTSVSAMRPASYALPSSPDAVAQTRRQTPFRYLTAIGSGGRADDLRAALVPWMELIGRDPFDPAVQEGMLAVPYALAHLGSQEQSAEYAQRAIAQLDAAHGLLEQAAAQIGTGLIPLVDAYLDDARDGWHQQLGALAPQKRWWLGGDVEPNYYAGLLLADRRFVAMLEDYRTLRQLQRFVDAAGGSPERAALLADAQAAGEAQRERLKARAAAVLAERSRSTAQDLAEAHLWIARLRDRSTQQVTTR